MSDKPIHTYDDDIRELDNELPLWWRGILYGTIIFATCYWIWFQVLRAGENPIDAYKAEKYAIAQEEAKKLAAEGELTGDKLEAMSRNVAIVGAGKATFVSTCAACHRADGGGQIGPNLTDRYWIHGSKPEDIIKVVRGGVLDKGMPAWGPQLGEQRVREVVSYVLTLRHTDAPAGKAAQGNPEI